MGSDDANGLGLVCGGSHLHFDSGLDIEGMTSCVLMSFISG